MVWEDLFGRGVELEKLREHLARFDVESARDFRPDVPVTIIVYRRPGVTP
jgi:hypothetical protein